MSRSDGKTEKATPQRRRKARQEGTVAKSQEVGMAASLIALLASMQFVLPRAAGVVRDETTRTFSTLSADPDALGRATDGAVRMLVGGAAPFLLVAVIAALAAGFGQVGFKLTPKAAKPKLSNLSPKKGLKRFKPSTAGWELMRTVVKLGLLVLIVWDPLRTWTDELVRSPGLDAGLRATGDQVRTLIVRATMFAVVVAAADYAWNRRKTAREMRMSKTDIRREHKDSEGDPLIRSQRRRRQQALSRNRMLQDVATADVVVTNPTHLAVALRYRDAEAAPRVVAKGADRVAAKIRRTAYANGVTVTEDKPLARALYRRCRIGQYVPAALYEAVAVVLALAYRRHHGALAPAGGAR